MAFSKRPVVMSPPLQSRARTFPSEKTKVDTRDILKPRADAYRSANAMSNDFNMGAIDEIFVPHSQRYSYRSSLNDCEVKIPYMSDTIIDRIQLRLKKLNISMRKASLEAGLSDAFIRNIISGKSESPRGINLTKLARALETTEVWLLSGEGPEEANAAPLSMSPEDLEFIHLWKKASEEEKQVILALLRSRRDATD